MMKRYVLPFVLLAMVGCGESQNATTETQATNGEITTQQSKNAYVSPLPDTAPTLKVAVMSDGAPYVILDELGTPTGYDVDVIRAIGEEMGFKVDFFPAAFGDLIPSVTEGHNDLTISGFARTQERLNNTGVSDSYMFDPSSLTYVKGSGTYDGLTSLAGKRVGIIVGGKQRADIEAVGGYAELTEYPTPYSLVEALAQDKIDVFAIQGSIADHFAKSFPQLNLESNPYESQSVAEAHVGVIVDKQNTKLLDDINAGIKKLKENGRLAEIQKKWLSEDLQKIQDPLTAQ